MADTHKAKEFIKMPYHLISPKNIVLSMSRSSEIDGMREYLVLKGQAGDRVAALPDLTVEKLWGPAVREGYSVRWSNVPLSAGQPCP